MTREVQPSRTAEDLRLPEAAALIRAADKSLDAAAALTVGWSRRQLIDVAITLAKVKASNIGGTVAIVLPHKGFGARMNAEERAWTDDQLRQAHHDFNRGIRTPHVAHGERIYSRLRKRQYDARKKAAS